jgi:hypothetical protein
VQAKAALVREAANAHAEAAAAQEALLQAKVEVAQEVKRVKEALARQAEKEVNSLKKKPEVAQQKANDAADDLQAMVDGTFCLVDGCYPRVSLLLFLISTFDVSMRQGGGRCPKEELVETKDQVKILEERTTVVWECRRPLLLKAICCCCTKGVSRPSLLFVSLEK